MRGKFRAVFVSEAMTEPRGDVTMQKLVPTLLTEGEKREDGEYPRLCRARRASSWRENGGLHLLGARGEERRANRLNCLSDGSSTLNSGLNLAVPAGFDDRAT